MKLKKGFTLIELLVVISIIALLLSILMPALSKVRQQARIAVCTSNVRQWALACTAYAAEHDGYYPGRVGNIRDFKYDYSWPWQYYKAKGEDLIYVDLLSSFFKPYLGDSSDFIFCPDIPENAPWHDVGGESIVGKSWEEIEELIMTGSDHYLDGDYALYVGYGQNDKQLLQVTGNNVRWGGTIPVPPDMEREDRSLTSPSPSPVKMSNATPGTAIVGDRAAYAGSGATGIFRYSHPYREGVPEEPKGMCASFVNGSAGWVEFENWAAFMQYRGGTTWYWPKPDVKTK